MCHTTCCKKGNAACSSWILYISHNWSFPGGTQRPTFEFSIAWCPPNPSNVDLGAFCKTCVPPQLEMFQSFSFGKSFEGTCLSDHYVKSHILYKLQNMSWDSHMLFHFMSIKQHVHVQGLYYTFKSILFAMQMVIPNTASARDENHISPHVHDCGYDYHVSSGSSIRPQHSLVSLILLTSPCLRWGHSIRLADVPVFLFLLIKEP